MFSLSALRVLSITLTVAAGASAEITPAPASEWVSMKSGDALAYKSLPRGDCILDFSFAGYGGGGVRLPTVATTQTLKPSGGDDTAPIQAALDSLARLDPHDGFRGALMLERGIFHVSASLQLATDGVVLRGSGSEANGTTLEMIGKPHLCLSLGARRGREELRPSTLITDAYVASGSTTFPVADPAGLHEGDRILITRPSTPAWVHFMGMDVLVRDGKKQTWVGGDIVTERTIAAIDGRTLRVDIPLADSFDAQLLNPPGTFVQKAGVSPRTAHVGVESLSIVSPAQAIGITQPQHQAIRTEALVDGWLRDIAILDTINSVSIGGDSRRITLENIRISHTVATVGAAKPADFSASGSQILFHRCTSTGDNLFYFVTGPRAPGPNVLLDCTFEGGGWIQPHARWATGLLVDRCKVPGGGIDFMNRGEMGSGHGWTIGWAVAWNCEAKSFTIQQPPGAANWAIGCIGDRKPAAMPFTKEPKLPEGIFDSHGTHVAPASLYLAQLRARLGPTAVENLGY